MNFEDLLELGPPRRPGYGTKGQQFLRVRTNYLEIKLLPREIIHYDITIKPTVPPRLNRRIFEQFINTYDFGRTRPVYDGRSNMFSSQKLPFRDDAAKFDVIFQEGNTTTVTSKKPPQKFVVELKKVGQINLDILQKSLDQKCKLNEQCITAMTALDVLISHKTSANYITIKKSFYPPEKPRQISGGLEIWQGYYQSARPTKGRMMINVDLSATAFYMGGPLVELVASMLDKKTPNDLRNIPTRDFDKIFDKVERLIKSLQIRDNHRDGYRRRFRITGLARTSPSDTYFNKDGTRTSVEDYFQEEYNRRLKYPHLPCVKIKEIYLPMEVCDVIGGQQYLRKLTSKQTSEMMDFTRQDPSVRLNEINRGIGFLDYNNNENLQQFGMRVSNELATVNARVLPAPRVHYHPSSHEPSFIPRDGAWNLRNKKVAASATLNSWSVVSFKDKNVLPEQVIRNFIRELIQTCMDTGMNIPNKTPPIMYGNIQNPEQELKTAWLLAGNDAKVQPQLILCILPFDSKEFYAEIKRVSDTVIGVATQCIQSTYLKNPRKQYCANVCLKINVKLGGMNSFLNPTNIEFIVEEPTIVMGADVTHPKPGILGPSIAALCASTDVKASRYYTVIEAQNARKEIIVGLKSMVIEALKAFYYTTSKQPQRILFYRDGVSDGQFEDVLKLEVGAIRAACQSLNVNYKPKITFVVVKKRHHTRFFPLGRQESDRSRNCFPGTVVDTEITHPYEFDFYLQSHAGILGTSRPAHYHVLFDQNGFNSDSLQLLTYNLCYSYARCTRAISVVPPVYYAHFACARAKLHLKGGNWSDIESSEAGSTGTGAPPILEEVKPVKQELKKYMYFM